MASAGSLALNAVAIWLTWPRASATSSAHAMEAETNGSVLQKITANNSRVLSSVAAIDLDVALGKIAREETSLAFPLAIQIEANMHL